MMKSQLPKDALAIMIGKMSAKKDDMGMDDEQSMREDLMDEFLQAVQKKDPKQMAQSLKDFIDCCHDMGMDDEESEKE